MFVTAGYSVSALSPDRLRLDGGAMFGAVPKSLWAKLLPADESNRIQMTCRVLLLERGARRILVDTGCGDVWSDKERSIYAISPVIDQPLHQLLGGSVTDIVLTHLHFDHAGGVVRPDADGAPVLAFPGTAIHLQTRNWEHAHSPGPRERASYLERILAPLAQAQLLLAQDGDEVLPDITVHRIDGHTHGMQWLLIGTGKDALAYAADLIPTAHHLSIPYVMGYDLCAETTMREKAQFLEEAVKNEWWVIFDHDAETCMVKVAREAPGRYIIAERAELPPAASSASGQS